MLLVETNERAGVKEPPGCLRWIQSEAARVAAKDALAAGDLAGVAAAASALRSGIAIENQIEI